MPDESTGSARGSSSRMRPASRGAIAVCILMAIVGSACSETTPGGSVSPAGSTPSPGADLETVQEATRGAGDAKVRVDVQAHMPEDFDDGVPDRAFSGTGFLDQDRTLAGVEFEMSKIPNSAGYFGHVDGRLSVFYSESEFVLSFPQMAETLPGPLDWLSYDLELMADPEAQKLGIGQLREIGLSDPRLGLALLRGADALQEGPPPSTPMAATPTSMPTPTGRVYKAVADVAAAMQASGPELEPVLAGLQALGVTSVDVGVTVDDEDRLETIGYTLSYAPKPGSEPVEVRITHSFLRYGLEGGLNAPTGRSVSSFREYTGI